MKYLIPTLLAAISVSSLAIDMQEYAKLHPAGFGLQINGGDLDLAYYSPNHDYLIAIGSVTFNSEKTDSTTIVDDSPSLEQENEREFKTSLYLRKNFPLTERSNVGIGISFGKIFAASGDTCKMKKSYLASQYISFEYALSPKFFLLASIKPIKIEYLKTTNGDTEGDNTQDISVFAGGSVQLTYII